MDLKHSAVRRKAQGIITESWQSQANLTFFLALEVLLAFVLPVLGFGKEHYQMYSNIAFSVLVLSGVAIAWNQRKLFLLLLIVGTTALIVRCMEWLSPTLKPALWGDWWTLATIIVISFVLLLEVFREGSVTPARVQGAIAVYLLFGMGWAQAYHITGILHPGSFTVAMGERPQASDWFYFSYVTLTTLGYGDITPVLPIARMLAIGEALTGQLYLAVLIARLVAMEVISWQERANRNSGS